MDRESIVSHTEEEEEQTHGRPQAEVLQGEAGGF